MRKTLLRGSKNRNRKSKRISRLKNHKTRKHIKRSQTGGTGPGHEHMGHEHMNHDARMEQMHNTAQKLNLGDAENMMEHFHYMNLPESHLAHQHIERIKYGEKLEPTEIKTVRTAINLHSKLSEQLKDSGVSPEHVYPLFQHLKNSVTPENPVYKHVENLLQGNPLSSEGIKLVHNAIEEHKNKNYSELSRNLGYSDTNQMIDSFFTGISNINQEILTNKLAIHNKKLSSGIKLSDAELNDLKYLQDRYSLHRKRLTNVQKQALAYESATSSDPYSKSLRLKNKMTGELGYDIPSELSLRMDLFKQQLSPERPAQNKILGIIGKINSGEDLQPNEDSDFKSFLKNYDANLQKYGGYLEYGPNGKVIQYISRA